MEGWRWVSLLVDEDQEPPRALPNGPAWTPPQHHKSGSGYCLHRGARRWYRAQAGADGDLHSSAGRSSSLWPLDGAVGVTAGHAEAQGTTKSSLQVRSQVGNSKFGSAPFAGQATHPPKTTLFYKETGMITIGSCFGNAVLGSGLI